MRGRLLWASLNRDVEACQRALQVPAAPSRSIDGYLWMLHLCPADARDLYSFRGISSQRERAPGKMESRGLRPEQCICCGVFGGEVKAAGEGVSPTGELEKETRRGETHGEGCIVSES